MLEDLNAYHIFYEVARRKSMSAASQQLGITPVTVTRTIQGLEKNLGRPLLIRMNRGVALTEEGGILYDRIKFTFDSLAAAEERILRPPSPRDSQLTIGLTSYAPRGLLLESCLPKLRSRCPDLQVSLLNVSKIDIVDAILNGVCDFVFGALVNIDSHRITNLPLFSDRIVAAVGARYGLPQEKPADFDALRDIPLISLPLDRDMALRASMLYRNNGAPYRPAVIVPDMACLAEAVAAGHGYAFLPSSALTPTPPGVIVLDTDFPYFDDIIFSLYFQADGPLGTAKEHFIRILEEETADRERRSE